MSYFSGKSALITGAGSGIGRALAQALHGAGCGLYLSDVNSESLEETRQLLGPGPTVDIQVVDVADRAAVNTWAEQIASQRESLDIVINNAGVALTERVDRSRYEDVQWLMGINFWGVVHGTMAFLPLLQRSPGGHLVNISSIFGILGIPTQSAYNASKFAVRGYTEALRQELADTALHVCCVHPGGIRTNIARNARVGEHDQAAREKFIRRFDKVARTTPETAAADILKAIEKRKKRLLIGSDARYMALLSRLFPVNYPRFLPGLGGVGRS